MKFKNQTPYKGKNLFEVLKWKLSSNKVKWDIQKDIIIDTPKLTKNESDLAITWIGHSTFYIQYHNLSILTDPIWSKKPSRIGPKRVINPPISIPNLKKLDVVLISHNHYDHMDIPTLKSIRKFFNPTIITGIGNAKKIRKIGFDKVFELNWFEKLEINNLEFHFVPAQHWSGRMIFDSMKTLFGGFVLKSIYGNVYFAGDTAKGIHGKQLKDCYKNFRLSLIPIGAYKPRWFMKSAHIDPKEAVELHMELNSSNSIGMHFGTFPLANEAIDDPLIDLEIAKRELNVSNFTTIKIGETKFIV